MQALTWAVRAVLVWVGLSALFVLVLAVGNSVTVLLGRRAADKRSRDIDDQYRRMLETGWWL